MKNTAPFLLLVLFGLLAFLAGKCSGERSVVAETVVKTDTIIQEKIIEIEPIPEPIPEQKTRAYYVYDTKAADSLQELLSKEIDYHVKILREKEKTIARLEAKQELGVGEAIGTGSGIGFEVTEDQNVNVYYIEETDSLGTRLQGRISVLGKLYEPEPPLFNLTYPEVFRSEVQTIDRTKRKAIGLNVDVVGQFEKNLPDYRLGAFYRTGAFSLGGNWQVREQVAALRLGIELGW